VSDTFLARPLRILFFGTPEFALVSLDALLRSRHQVVGVVTQPDRPRGRGQRVSESPVKQRAVSTGLPVLQPERLRDTAFIEAATALQADLGVVAAYWKILTDRVLALPPRGLLNVHGSVLPRYRGAAPVHRAIIAGDTETGVTIMRVVKALDAGPMFATATRPIALDETSATYAPRLTKEDGHVDWSWPAVWLHNLIRGLHPWPHASAFLNDRRVILHRSAVSGAAADAAPGTILEAHGDRLLVATGNGALDLVEVQAEGKRKMRVREFLAGHSVAVGDRFADPVPRS
jgi:methionyl-tRNA formyltransferase